MNKKINRKIRVDIRTISMHPSIWEQVKELAERDGRSVSAFIREWIKKLYKLKTANSKV